MPGNCAAMASSAMRWCSWNIIESGTVITAVRQKSGVAPCRKYANRRHRVLPPPERPERLLHRTVVLVAAPTPDTALRVHVAERRVSTVAPEGVASNEDVVRARARDEAALRMVAQHCDELGAIVGLAAQRLV